MASQRSGLRSSSQTSSLPPQESPTLHAESSLTPKCRRLEGPPASTSWAASTTAPSTQPPLTEPTRRESVETAILAPSRRGEEPHVRSTVARATGLSSAIHSDTFSRMSNISLAFHHLNLSPLIRRPECSPSRVAVRFSRLAILRTDKNSSTWGEHRQGASGSGLELSLSEEWIQPDESVTCAMQASHFSTEQFWISSIPTIRNQEHDCSVAQNSTTPRCVESAEGSSRIGPRGPNPAPANPPRAKRCRSTCVGGLA